MKLKTVVLVPIVAALVGYGALKGLLYYRVQTDLKRVSDMAAPFAEISYDGIETSLKGQVAVTGLRVIPAGAPLDIGVDRIELSGQGIEFLLGVITGFDPQKPPEQLQLSLQRLRAPLGDEYQGGWSLGERGKKPPRCSLGGLLSQRHLQELGYQQLVADLRIRYRLTPASGELSMNMDMVQYGVSSLGMEAQMSGVRNPAMLALGVPPSLKSTRLTFRMDKDYLERAVGFCAEQEGETKAAYVERLFAQQDNYFAANLGFVPGSGIRHALRQMLAEGAQIELEANPNAELNPAVMSVYKPQQLVDLLGLELYVDQQLITDLSFSLPRQSDISLGQMLSNRSQGNAEVTEAAPRKKRSPARFIDTPLESLSRHQGRDVRVHTSDREEPQIGILAAVGDGQLDLEQRVYGGKMTIYIPLQRVQRVEVFRRETLQERETAEDKGGE